jgi:hypothetical protein
MILYEGNTTCRFEKYTAYLYSSLIFVFLDVFLFLSSLFSQLEKTKRYDYVAEVIFDSGRHAAGFGGDVR